MGIDLQLAAKTKKRRSKEELRELNYRFMEASTLGYGKNPIKDADNIHDSQNFYYELSSLSRYYGQGYARGSFPEIYAAIEWFRVNFPEADILYGGDGEYLEEMVAFTKQKQEELLRFWCENGGLTYRNSKPKKPIFNRKCPNCEVVMSQYMYSGENGAINCLGCRFAEETKDGGATWFEVKRD